MSNQLDLGNPGAFPSTERGAPIALDIWDAIVQYRLQTVAVFLLVFVVGAAYSLVSPSVYIADTLIQVEDKKQNPLPGMSEIANALNVGENNIQGELDILKSRDVIGRAITSLSLNVVVEPLHRVPIFADRFERHVGGRGLYLAPVRFNMDRFQWGGEKVVISELTVPSFYEGRAFTLTVTGSDAWSLADLNGTVLAEGRTGTPTFFSISNATGTILVKELFARSGETFSVVRLPKIAAYKRIAAAVNAAETVKSSGVIRVTYQWDDPSDATAILGQIAGAYVDQNVSRGAEDASKALEFLERQLPQLKQTMESSEEALSKYQISRQSISLDKEATSLLDRSVELGKAKLDAEMKRGQLLQIFKPDHPQVQAVDQEIRQIQGEESQLSSEVKRLPDTQQGLLALSRDQKINTDIYTALLSSAEQYKVAKAGTIGNVRVVDAAAASPIPSKPNRSVLLAVSVLAGAIAALVAAMVRRTLQPYFLSADDVEKRTALPVYGTIPESKLQSSLFLGRRHVEKKSRLLQVLAPTDLAIESLRSLQLAMQFAMSGTENKNILITGPTSSLGKSFISANLAAVLGGTGKRVLLVDTDMRKPRLHQYFSLKLSPGLADLLAARSPFSEILNIGVVPNVDVISAGTKPPNPSELLVNGRIEKLLEWAQDKYDTVVLDSPPLLPVGDAVIVAKSVGAVFLVLRFEQSTPAEALEAMRRLDNVGISPKGVIFNGLRLDRLRYGYQYRGYYGYA